MSVTTCDRNLGFLGKILRTSYFDPLNNGNPFAPPIYPGTALINATGTSAQVTEVVRLYKEDKEQFTTYCEFHIILISMITNKFPEKYMTNLEHCIAKFCQCEPLTLLNHLYTEYRTIASSKCTANSDCMTVCCNPPTPIADLFQQLNYGEEFVEEGNEIINDIQLLCL